MGIPERKRKKRDVGKRANQREKREKKLRRRRELQVIPEKKKFKKNGREGWVGKSGKIV